jgi:hypothetical protein
MKILSMMGPSQPAPRAPSTWLIDPTTRIVRPLS